MKLQIYETSFQTGQAAAKLCAQLLNEAIEKKGEAVLLLSTGASQFDFFKSIVEEKVDWNCVEMFHLDEYCGLPETHKASFVKYLKEKFTSKVNLKKAHFISGEGDVKKTIDELSHEIQSKEIDVGMIGIGENAHIAFNDPPADFETQASYKVVHLNDTCKNQQVREGWFESLETVCKQAISMTCSQIMKCKHIISVVPYEAKAKAIRETLENDITNLVPATLLKKHNSCCIMCDKNSARELTDELIKKYS